MLDVAIIGAGLAGLSAALRLQQSSSSFAVLEARDRVGGRVENAALPTGGYVELGGQWVGGGHVELLGLAERFAIPLLEPAAGALSLHSAGRITTVESSAQGLTPFEVSDLAQGLLRLRRLAQRVAVDPRWVETNSQWLAQDVRRWVAANLRTPGARAEFVQLYEQAVGELSSGTPLREALGHVGRGDLDGLLAANGALNQLRLRGGVYALCEAMARELGETLHLNSPVERLSQDDEAVTLRLADGQEIQARRVISTLPPRLAAHLECDPPLGQWRADAADKVPAGNVIKAFLIYSEPFWRHSGLSGQSSADSGAVRVTLDTTVDSAGILMGFFEGAEADSYAARSPQDRQAAFVEAAVERFGAQAAEPVAYLERDWSTQRYTLGCHGAHFAPGLWQGHGPALAQPQGRLHFAGAEYSERFNGFLEGAARSGLAAADAVMAP